MEGKYYLSIEVKVVMGYDVHDTHRSFPVYFRVSRQEFSIREFI